MGDETAPPLPGPPPERPWRRNRPDNCRGERRWAPGPETSGQRRAMRGTELGPACVPSSTPVAWPPSSPDRQWAWSSRTQRLAERDSRVARSAVGTSHPRRDVRLTGFSVPSAAPSRSRAWHRLAACAMAQTRIPPLSSAIPVHIVADWHEFAKLQSASRALFSEVAADQRAFRSRG